MVIKEYCIIYEVIVDNYIPIEGVYTTTFRNYGKLVTKTITMPATSMEDVIDYVTNQLRITNIKEIFEL